MTLDHQVLVRQKGVPSHLLLHPQLQTQLFEEIPGATAFSSLQGLYYIIWSNPSSVPHQRPHNEMPLLSELLFVTLEVHGLTNPEENINAIITHFHLS